MASKIIKNTTGSDIFVIEAGYLIPASGQREIRPTDYLIWSSDAVITEITANLLSGALVVNDGYTDLSAATVDGNSAALSYLRYSDLAWNVRFLSNPDRVNGFTSKDVQRAIEEAKSGGIAPAPTTTTDATPTVAYTATLDDDSVYLFDVRVSVRRTDVVGESGDFQIQCRAKRESAGGASVTGDVYQERASRDDSAWSVDFDTSGNDLRFIVTGALGKTIKWQPQVELEQVS